MFSSPFPLNTFSSPPKALQIILANQWGRLDILCKQMLLGTPDMIRQRLEEYEQAGVQEMILYFVDAAQLESVRLFAREYMHTSWL